MKTLLALVTVTLALGAGCGKKDKTAGAGSGTAGSGSAMATGSGNGSATAPAGNGSGAAVAGGPGVGPNGQTMTHRGGMCPSTVFGSTTTAELKDGKIVLAVSATDKEAIEAIQKRTEQILKEKTDGGDGSGGGAGTGGGAHDQKGSHGGGLGICPVHLPEGATATSDKTDKGVTITITPKGAADALKTEIDGRIKSAADWVAKNVPAAEKGNGGGIGGGSGNDGMNHSGQGDGKGMERKAGAGSGSGSAAAGTGSAAK